MGWLALFTVGMLAAAALWRLGVARPLWGLAGAALMLGAIGYALQGSPNVVATPRAAGARGVEIDPAIVELRGAMFGRFTQEAAIMTASDALLRSGAEEGAVRLLLGSINSYPRDAELWTGLGSNLAVHDGGQVSPAARFAFARAIRLVPKHPGPRFFLGLAYVRAQDYRAALNQWQQALDLCPADASYRSDIALRVALLQRLLAITR